MSTVASLSLFPFVIDIKKRPAYSSSMDAMQRWAGAYFGLDEAHAFLASLPEEAHIRTKVHELFLTWVVGRFLQAKKKSTHYIGFPTFDSSEGRKLSDFVFGRLAIDDENFDTVIIDSKKPEEPIRIQVKRYINRKNPSTYDLFKYICDTTERYGEATDINIVFHVKDNLKFDRHHFWQLAEERQFRVATIWVFVELSNSPQRCALFQVHPNRSLVWWSPFPSAEYEE